MQSAARLFAEQGFDATSTQAIAAESGITVAAIYRHFPSKSDLLVAVADEALETTFAATIGAADAPTVDDIAGIVVAYVAPEREFTRRLVVELATVATRHAEVAVALQRFHVRARDHLAAVLRAGQRAGRIPRRLDATATARDVLMMTMGVCHLDALDPSLAEDVAWRRSLRRTVERIIALT